VKLCGELLYPVTLLTLLTLLGLLDMSAAFDTVDDEILLRVLKYLWFSASVTQIISDGQVTSWLYLYSAESHLWRPTGFRSRSPTVYPVLCRCYRNYR